MKKQFLVIFIITCALLVLPTFFVELGVENNLPVEGPKWFVIEGLVENRLNFTYAELHQFPLVSEVTMLQCVGGGQGGPKVTYNWTGIPLFYLLNLANVIPGGYRKIVFNASDGFSSSITLQAAMEPTTLIGLMANGTDLEQIDGLGNGYKVVLPCRWGYKWVKWIRQIVVVDYDYKGDYESRGLSDEAFRPNSTMPTTTPPIQNFTVTSHSNAYTVRAMSNSSLNSLDFNQNVRLLFNVAGQEGTSGYLYVTFNTGLLTSPYQLYIDQIPVNSIQTYTDGNVYLYVAYSHSNHNIEIRGIPSSSDSGGGASSSRHLLT